VNRNQNYPNKTLTIPKLQNTLPKNNSNCREAVWNLQEHCGAWTSRTTAPGGAWIHLSSPAKTNKLVNRGRLFFSSRLYRRWISQPPARQPNKHKQFPVLSFFRSASPPFFRSVPPQIFLGVTSSSPSLQVAGVGPEGCRSAGAAGLLLLLSRWD
jgi:hypothetical protein